MENDGYDSAAIEDAVDAWADRAIQERKDQAALAACEAKQAALRKLDYPFGGFKAVSGYRVNDGLILATPDGNLAFELHLPTQNRLAELALAVRWAINKGLIDLASFHLPTDQASTLA